jgi:hypothetical protein
MQIIFEMITEISEIDGASQEELALVNCIVLAICFISNSKVENRKVCLFTGVILMPV